MKTTKGYSGTVEREASVDVDTLLAVINEVNEDEVRRSQNDSEHVNINGCEYHTQCGLADVFEPDAHDFSVSKVNH